jgi:CHASE1-domain containing sensor protein
VERHPGIQALSWDPLVSDKERAGFVNSARQKDFQNFTITERGANNKLIKAGKRGEYVPVYYIEPFGKNQSALGYDVLSDPFRRDAMTPGSGTAEQHFGRRTGKLERAICSQISTPAAVAALKCNCSI